MKKRTLIQLADLAFGFLMLSILVSYGHGEPWTYFSHAAFINIVTGSVTQVLTLREVVRTITVVTTITTSTLSVPISLWREIQTELPSLQPNYYTEALTWCSILALICILSILIFGLCDFFGLKKRDP